MQVDKKYRLKEECTSAFMENAHCNNEMVRLIDKNGGWFTVRNVSKCDYDLYVDEIEFANGQVAGSGGFVPYFELAQGEFKYFEKIKDESITLTVYEGNAEEMIALIKKTFNK
ncbi:hypothetical protein KNT65_gp185 [Escherichia phage EcS1]|uniref:Frd2 domain-containing protein n=1 Tax=Escherichia phage EcS1 TaxID=2083276 RepID=A0A2Z5ZCC1_9CAUD|nr:hypothetical protein KNT65_gp185 [Escherichia phage EcS1]BBC78308.1 Hypothetical protein [Escherichia phage EcS1]